MLYLPGSIIFTSYLTLSFEIVERHGINSFRAIVFNYLTCVITGSLVNGSGKSAAVISINNPGIVLFSALVTALAFRESSVHLIGGAPYYQFYLLPLIAFG